MESLLRSINPATGALLAEYPVMRPAEIEARLAAAAEAARHAAAEPPAARARCLARLAALLESREDALAADCTREMGKPIREARAEVQKCAWVCRHYAERAEAHLAPKPADTDARRSYVALRPLGPLLAIMPWNFPYWQVFRALAPALALGNPFLLKHAPNVTGCALAIERLAAEAGAAPAMAQALRVPVAAVPDLIADERVRAVTLTGSERAGREVGAHAGRALKPCVLELGGSDAFIVLEDADLDAAAEAGVRSRMQNGGQSCIAAKRFIVHTAVYDDFAARFAARAAALRTGDPLLPETDMGPLIREEARAAVHRQVEASLAAGARLAAGGRRPEGAGFFYPPTVLTHAGPEAPAFAEEVFGPVATLVEAADEAHAVALANAVRFGLGAAVWTREAARGERLAPRLEAGSVFVNGLVKSDPRLPFGGVKDSGFGRELGAEGLSAFANVQTVWVGAGRAATASG